MSDTNQTIVSDEELKILADTPSENGLDKDNPHPRDAHIQFFDEGHIYDIDGDRSFMSTTTFVHTFFEEFDADKIIKKMMGGKNWEKSKYFGMTPDEIKEQWEENRDLAARNGTLMHACIEYFYNKWTFPFEPPIEFKEQFPAFTEKVVEEKGYLPYRTEWFVYDKEHKIAGSIDMLYQVSENDPDTLLIYDWKRTAKLTKTNSFQSGKGPLAHLPDTNYWHYTMQLNIYRHILETLYDKKIAGMFLVAFHPTRNTFSQEQVPRLEQETQDLFDWRKKNIQEE